MPVEYRVRYSASSNSSFHNDRDDWEPWDDDEATPAEVEEELTVGGVDIPRLPIVAIVME